MKVVINKRYGGFGLSKKAVEHYLKFKFPEGVLEYVMPSEKEDSISNYFKLDGEYFSEHGVDRTDPILINIIESLGDEANSWCSQLKVVEIPDDVEWEIEEYDGQEWIAEKHRTWS